MEICRRPHRLRGTRSKIEPTNMMPEISYVEHKNRWGGRAERRGTSLSMSVSFIATTAFWLHVWRIVCIANTLAMNLTLPSRINVQANDTFQGVYHCMLKKTHSPAPSVGLDPPVISANILRHLCGKLLLPLHKSRVFCRPNSFS